MKKKLRLVFIVCFVFFGGYFLNTHLKDDNKEITRIVNSFNQPFLNIVHVEFLDNSHAIAFYESSPTGELYFGSAIFRKGLFGWKSLGSFSSQVPKDYKLDWGFSNLKQAGFTDYTDLIRGKILDPEIEKVTIKTKGGKEYSTKVIEYNNSERFWFLVSSGEDLLASTIIGISKEGKIIDEAIR